MPSLDTEELVENVEYGNDDEPTDKSQSGQTIGIIYPPPEVRSILNLEIFVNVYNIFKRFTENRNKNPLNQTFLPP